MWYNTLSIYEKNTKGDSLETLTYLKAIILGLVQGLAEFLPISSSGHLTILQHFFGIESEGVLVFTVLLHLGTLVAVFVVYWRDIVALCAELGRVIRDLCTGKGLQASKNETRRLGVMIIVATIPTALIGLLFNDLFERFYTNLLYVGIGLIITGTLLFAAQRVGTANRQVMEMNYRNAVFIGIMQGVAITPGISRSGSTLFGGLLTGLDREFAVRFAFLISIPSILGSFIMELPEAIELGSKGVPMGPVFVGMLVAAVSGFLAIKAMIRVVVAKKLAIFSWYTWILGGVVLLYGIFSFI